MTGEQLREELARIAEGAPDVHVETDVFDRGRRAHRRAQVLVAGAVVACLALVAGVGWQLTRDDPAPIAEGESRAGVPDHIYAPEEEGTDLDVSPLDQVGPASFAFQTDELEGYVVIGLQDGGEYRTIELPGRYEPMLDEVGPLLSPDGRRLAYQSEAGGVRGISVIDLATGTLTDLDLIEPLGAVLRGMQWSPNGRWLTWSGQPLKSSDANGSSYRSRVVGGLLDVQGLHGRVLPGHRPRVTRPRNEDRVDWDDAGVCDDGTVFRYVWPVFLVLDGDATVRERSWTRLVAAHGACSPPHSYLRGVPESTEVLGWLPNTADNGEPIAVLLTPDWLDDDRSSYRTSSLRLRTPAGTRDVATVESVFSSFPSVATGLMTAERPTVPAGPDPWPDSSWSLIQRWLAGGLLLALVASGAWIWVRNHRPIIPGD